MAGRLSDVQVDRQTVRQANVQVDRQTVRQADIQSDWAGRYTDRNWRVNLIKAIQKTQPFDLSIIRFQASQCCCTVHYALSLRLQHMLRLLELKELYYYYYFYFEAQNLEHVLVNCHLKWYHLPANCHNEIGVKWPITQTLVHVLMTTAVMIIIIVSALAKWLRQTIHDWKVLGSILHGNQFFPIAQ